MLQKTKMKLVIVMFLLAITTIFSAREPKQIMLENQGMISGMYITRFRTKRIVAYLGIPYAQPPIEYRRFAPPDYNDLPTWEGIRNATEYAPDCMQNDPKKEDVVRTPLKKHDELFFKILEAQLEKPREREFSDDCLYLNVYVPDGKKTLLFIQSNLNFIALSPSNITNIFHNPLIEPIDCNVSKPLNLTKLKT